MFWKIVLILNTIAFVFHVLAVLFSQQPSQLNYIMAVVSFVLIFASLSRLEKNPAKS